MKKILVVTDIQKDFVDGSLGTAEAEAMIPNAVKKIREFEGKIFATYDTHFDNYSETREGRILPVAHCIKGTPGWELDPAIAEALSGKDWTPVEKLTFGSTELPELIRTAAGDDEFSVEFIGLCTDICVLSNAIIVKNTFPEIEVYVDASCCAGVTPETHNAALISMSSCQIIVTGKE